MKTIPLPGFAQNRNSKFLRAFQIKNNVSEILENDEIMEKLRAEKFDAFFGEQVHPCGNGLAYALGIKSHFWIQR